MNWLSSFCCCLQSCPSPEYSYHQSMVADAAQNEKTPLLDGNAIMAANKDVYMTRPEISASEIDKRSIAFLTMIRTAEVLNSELTANLTEEKFTVQGWTETIAKAILERTAGLVNDLETCEPMAVELLITRAFQTLLEHVRKAAEDIFDFSRDHPIPVMVFSTLVAIGIIYFLAPWVLAALGFSGDGVVAGSYAAEWQSLYRGYVSKGSIFAYMQHLGALYA